MLFHSTTGCRDIRHRCDSHRQVSSPKYCLGDEASGGQEDLGRWAPGQSLQEPQASPPGLGFLAREAGWHGVYGRTAGKWESSRGRSDGRRESAAEEAATAWLR